MATKEEVKQVLENTVAKRFEMPKIAEKFKDFTKTIQLTYPNLETSHVMKITDGKLESITEEKLEKPDINVKVDSDVLIKIINKEIGALRAYTTGKIKVKGAMRDLLKLQKLLF